MNDYAPILICTLNRYKHFRNCVESLANCTDAKYTDLYIGLDYPLNEEHWEGFELINAYLDTIVGFKSLNIIRRGVNFGVKKNFDEAIQHIFLNNDFLILSEDDNEFSIDFIQYMNISRNMYKNRGDIFAICGYGFPFEVSKKYTNQNYIWTGFSGWGAGIWKEKWNEIIWNKNLIDDKFVSFSNNLLKMYNFSKIANIYPPAIYNQISSSTIHGDIVISLHLFESSKFCVFPVISRVRNIGHDGSGLNCSYAEHDMYSSQKIYNGSNDIKLRSDLNRNELIYRELSNYYKIPRYKRFKQFSKNLLKKYFK